ncbi:EamA family transporter [Stieleria sp. ICT_E10.1]|uniref:DMT family transporter n=1 Tax=Stieleria sedimenti TaxID=2976331 RepID=UPI00217FCD6C|nr:EamA family transporter [Stieleria sedimenti]MCS7468900.1 EamA family transporter [Stieleria sedimenti]
MPSPRRISWQGPVCGIASAVLYTLTNIALRNCVDVDAYLVSAVKAAPTVFVLGPLVGWLSIRPTSNRALSNGTSANGTSANRPSPATLSRSALRRLPQFILASFLAQFFGNAAFQKALERIGLAASVPITLGVLIVGGAILGAVLLKEPVGRRKVIAMITLIVAVVVLSLPDRPVHEPLSLPLSDSLSDSLSANAETIAAGEPALPEPALPEPALPEPALPEPIDLVVGSLWAAVSGLAYAFFGVTMRQTLQTGIPARNLMLISGVTGSVALWGFCFATLGHAVILSTSPSQWTLMVTAGCLNFSAFVAITTALRLLPVVAVNLINASQVAMAGVAGVILFDEPITTRLAVGIALTFVGLIILARRTRAPIVITD